MILHFKTAITVMNKYGDNDAVIDIPFDDFNKLQKVSAKILTADGTLLEKVKKSDFEDISSYDGISLYSDDRSLYYEYDPVSYPYTIEYEYVSVTSNTAFLPSWYPIHKHHLSSQYSSYSLRYPKDININVKDFNHQGHRIQNQSSEGHLFYSISNLKAYDYEPLSPLINEIVPHTRFASNKFNLAGENGEASNWKEFGFWMNERLLKGRDLLPENAVSEVKALVKGIKDPVKKAEIVYDYMQGRTRYISVQIGIGGWKPMKASEVDRLKYGDCKALTNYTMALLKAVDVPSYYTVLYADDKRHIDRDLAMIQGNHAILMVPGAKDTIWLECTNQKAPFGHIGSFTDDRDVLIVTEEGGKIVRTKKYKDSDNTQFISGELSIQNNGNIKASLKIKSEGIQYDDHYGIAYLDPDDQKKYYKSFFDEINNVSLGSIEVENLSSEAKFIERIDFTAENYSVNSGNKMLVRLNIVNTSSSVPKRIRNRKLPLEIKYGYVDTDEVTINLPSNYIIEAMGNPQSLETKFGNYSIQIERINDNALLYKRSLHIKQGTYPASDYEAYRKFRKKIHQLDHLKIALTKNQQL
nr:DUF3857 domain-containing transglutaminase family protein [Lutimonas saemankumensis]